MATDLNLFLAFGAGFLSFISPCTSSVVPSIHFVYYGHVTGLFKIGLETHEQKRYITYTVLFNRIFSYFCHYWFR